MAQLVRITDVSPRDGLQNESRVIPASQKVRLIELLAEARPDEIEVSSFVSPRWIPQLGDAAEVFAALSGRKPPDLCYSALVPNEKGLTSALAVNDQAGSKLIDKIAVFTAASESFALRNTNATIVETLARFRPVVRGAHAASLTVRGYISCAIGCPFEGPVAPSAVAHVADELAALGVDEIDLGDTIGAGSRVSTSAMLLAVLGSLGEAWLPRLTFHPHDTRGRARDCVLAALECGLRSFDGAAGGLGGCPYASTATGRAPGNLATETLLETVSAAGYATRVDAAKLRIAGEFARRLVAGGDNGAEHGPNG